jgi:hypothetical protein
MVSSQFVPTFGMKPTYSTSESPYFRKRFIRTTTSPKREDK